MHEGHAWDDADYGRAFKRLKVMYPVYTGFIRFTQFSPLLPKSAIYAHTAGASLGGGWGRSRQAMGALPLFVGGKSKGRQLKVECLH